MTKLKKWLNIGLYCLLSLVLFFQVMGLIGTSLSDVEAIQKNTWLIPVWIAAVYLIGMAVLLCKVWKNKEKLSLVPLVSAVIGTVLALVVALTLKAALPAVASSNVGLSGMQGLNGWRLFCRHISLVLVGAVTAVVSYVHYKQLHDERIRRENAEYQEFFTMDEELPPEDGRRGKKGGKKPKKT